MCNLSKLQKRFDAKWMPEPYSGCWLWIAAVSPQTGYGAFNKGSKKCDTAHRVSWMIYRGEIPAGLFVCHHAPKSEPSRKLGQRFGVSKTTILNVRNRETWRFV